MSQVQALEYIVSLSERELVEFMALALQPRTEVEVSTTGERCYAVLCLAQTTWYDEVDGGPPLVDLVATVHERVAKSNWDRLSQGGRCDRCKATVVSVAKVAVCPVCASEVDCT